MAVANPRCLYSCASSTRIASTPRSSKLRVSSVARLSISSARVLAFSFAIAARLPSFFGFEPDVTIMRSVTSPSAVSVSLSLFNWSRRFSTSFLRAATARPASRSFDIASITSIFSWMDSSMNRRSRSGWSGIRSNTDWGMTTISQSL